MAPGSMPSTKSCEQPTMTTRTTSAGRHIPATIRGTVTTAKQTTATVATSAAKEPVATMAGYSLLFSADEGDTQDRKEYRDPKHKCAIHRRFLLVLMCPLGQKNCCRRFRVTLRLAMTAESQPKNPSSVAGPILEPVSLPVQAFPVRKNGMDE